LTTAGRVGRGAARTLRTCQDVIGLLTEYLENGLTTEETRTLEAHLKLCEACEQFLLTLRKSASAVGGLRTADIPPECSRQLRAFLKRRTGPPKKTTRRRS
jgi:anti-sigma factor RsiW